MAQSPLDLTVLAELQDAVGHEFLCELVNTFLEEAPGMVGELKSALAGQDADGFRRAAHSLKSNAGTFGALELAGRARDLEMNGLVAAEQSGAIDTLEVEYKNAAVALKDYINA